MVKPGEVLGYVTDRVAEQIGVQKGMPVVATAHDKAVEALGAGTLAKGAGLVSLGTYIGALVHGREILEDTEDFCDNFKSVFLATRHDMEAMQLQAFPLVMKNETKM